MKKLIALALVTFSAVTQAASFEDTARVLSVQEKFSTGSTPRRVCDGQGFSSGPGVGTLIGAVGGGLLGSRVGQGNGRVAAAAVGATVGALSGHAIESNTGAGQNCYTTDNYNARVIGYTVTYEYNGRTFTDFFRNPPMGDTVRIRVNTTPAAY